MVGDGPLERFDKMAAEALDRIREVSIQETQRLHREHRPMDMETFISTAYQVLRCAETETVHALEAVSRERPEAEAWDAIASRAKDLLGNAHEQMMKDCQREWHSVTTIEMNRQRFGTVVESIEAKLASFVEGEKKALREARERRNRDVVLLVLGAAFGAVFGQLVNWSWPILVR